MAGDYRELPQWQALNRIWKAVPQSAREGVKDDFRLVTDMIKASAPENADKAASASDAPPRAPRENYLAGMSSPARRLALGLIAREGFDIYGYLESLMEKTGARDGEQLWDAYIAQRDVSDGEEDALREIIGACIARRDT